MNVQITQLAPIRVVMIRHTGSYDQISAVFDQLFGWVGTNGVPVQRTIGIYWDNPEYVPASRLRSAACVEVPATFQLGDRGGLALEMGEIVGGSYATTRYVGPYENLSPVWSQFTQMIERQFNQKIGLNPAFEVYENDPSDTPPAELITDLYMPVV